LWAVTNLLVGALPLFAMIWCRWTEARPRNSVVEYTPDLVFLSMMATVSVIDDLKSVPATNPRKTDFEAAFGVGIFIIIAGAIILGTYYAQVVSTENLATMRNMFYAGTALAVLNVLACVVAKWYCLETM